MHPTHKIAEHGKCACRSAADRCGCSAEAGQEITAAANTPDWQRQTGCDPLTAAGAVAKLLQICETEEALNQKIKKCFCLKKKCIQLHNVNPSPSLFNTNKMFLQGYTLIIHYIAKIYILTSCTI